MIRPPTDNLYKFMAIAGIITVLFSLFYFSDRGSDLETKKDSFNLMNGLIAKEMSFLIDDLDYFIDDLGGIKEDIMNGSLDLTKLKSEDLVYQSKEFQDAYRELAIKQIEAESNELVLLRLSSELRFIFWASLILTFWGFGLVIFGFYFWYEKLQFYQDFEIKERFERKMVKTEEE